MDISTHSGSQSGSYVDMALLKDLISMGFDENRSRRGLIMTKNKDPEDAINWILEHADDPDIDDPIPPEGLKVAESKRSAPLPGFDLSSLEAAAERSLDAMAASLYTEYKMVLCVRQDLNMSIGKVGAQCAHAALGLYRRLQQANPKMLQEWERSGEKKVVVSINSAQELDDLERKAMMLSVPTHVVRDAGRTEIDPGTRTVLVVAGPDYAVNQVTGHLHLLK
eukprot:TRINITY_DN14683_c0_g1_i1.p1 TRINITY_DN14683_c0_g1~~TRINITY_DN14683_c0_g1_i1.p1  ORF type:complete len:230 (+),score=41.60 TRINITY_DN14683_c0_g1_i1:24-692(+)